MTDTTIETLARAKYVSLTTFRKNGRPVSTPVWIAPAPGPSGGLYAFSQASAGKIKRIRHNPTVLVAPSDFRGRVKGGALQGLARLLPPEDHRVADRALTRKYPIIKRLLDSLRLVQRGGERAYLEIRLEAAATHVA